MLVRDFINDLRHYFICKGEMNMRPQERYDKANMAMVGAKYKKEFIKEFKEACKSLGITQSEVIRKAMQATIDKAKESR